MDKIHQVMSDIKDQIKHYHHMASESFMEKDSRRYRSYRDIATGLDQALGIIEVAYEKHPSDE